jgi:hypothetical protein
VQNNGPDLGAVLTWLVSRRHARSDPDQLVAGSRPESWGHPNSKPNCFLIWLVVSTGEALGLSNQNASSSMSSCIPF